MYSSASSPEKVVPERSFQRSAKAMLPTTRCCGVRARRSALRSQDCLAGGATTCLGSVGCEIDTSTTPPWPSAR